MFIVVVGIGCAKTRCANSVCMCVIKWAWSIGANTLINPILICCVRCIICFRCNCDVTDRVSDRVRNPTKLFNWLFPLVWLLLRNEPFVVLFVSYCLRLGPFLIFIFSFCQLFFFRPFYTHCCTLEVYAPCCIQNTNRCARLQNTSQKVDIFFVVGRILSRCQA